MKKILPVLVVGILVLSGLGAVATPSDKADAKSAVSLGEVEAVAKGGFGVTITITNNGNLSIEKVGNATITIDALIIWPSRYYIRPIPAPIPAGGGSVSVSTGFVFGLGPGSVSVTVDIDGDDNIDGEAVKNGLIFGPIVLIGTIPIPLP